MALLAAPRRAEALDELVDYLVDTPDGAVGVADGWERDPCGQPTSLIVTQGWFGRRRFEIPIDLLLGVDHDDRRILVAPGSAPLEKGFMQRLSELLRERSLE